jgi:aspartyl-tRNA(Asn)/glutamyl-tRNA(Gln) amidotransferase subunit A
MSVAEADVAFLSARELIAHYRAGTLSPVEVTEVLLRRIERIDPQLNAYVTVTADAALEEARQAERALAAGGDVAPLAGVPVSIKDLTPTKGVRTTRGSLLYEDWVPDYDAPVVERLRAAGAVSLGKTNTPEFGWKGDSGNRVVGPTHNPFKHGRTAGGSSGGAAAAVAAGLGPLAQGSDGAGSIRLPAAFCGIVGLKPTMGLVPYYPPSALEPLSHNGPMTRTVRDAALMLNVMAGPDERDRFSLGEHRDVDYVAACDGPIEDWRVAWSPDLGHAAVDPEVREITANAVAVFEALGCKVEQIDGPLLECRRTIEVLWGAGQAAAHMDDYEQVRDRLDPGRVAVIEESRAFTAAEVAATVPHRSALYQEARELLDRYELLITPTMPLAAFTAGDDRPMTIDGKPTTHLGWTPFTYPFNLTGHPAITVPCGWTAEGLPVGLQLIAGMRREVMVLRAAAAFEEARPWAHRRPDLDGAVA